MWPRKPNLKGKEVMVIFGQHQLQKEESSHDLSLVSINKIFFFLISKNETVQH